MTIDIQVSDIIEVLPRLCGAPATEIQLESWSSQPLDAGGSQVLGGIGLVRITGVARVNGAVYPWSALVKGIQNAGEYSSDVPAQWNYWRREALVYRSGILETLPAGLTAPRCYAVQERPDGASWIWMEQIHETDRAWDMHRYARVARHLGQFNGAYLCGHPLPPAAPWMSSGRAREWFELAKPIDERSRQAADTPLAKRLFGQNGLERIHRLLAQCDGLLQAFERLPLCFCHHDAFCRNLLDRRTSEGGHETVAIDWAIAGFGRIGEEIGATTAVSLTFLEVNSKDAQTLDRVVFKSYLEGLQDVGWQDDARLARLGYTTNAFALSSCFTLFWFDVFQTSGTADWLLASLGRSFDEVIDAWAENMPFLLDMGDEAMSLAEALS